MKTIGEYYKETVLSLPEKERNLRELPVNERNLRIDRNLFTWRIYYKRYGRKTPRFIECATEEEARYLKVFMDAGVSKIYVPKNLEYLKSILPELEDLKAEHDKIINDGVKYILNRKTREKIKHGVWMELTQV